MRYTHVRPRGRSCAAHSKYLSQILLQLVEIIQSDGWLVPWLCFHEGQQDRRIGDSQASFQGIYSPFGSTSLPRSKLCKAHPMGPLMHIPSSEGILFILQICHSNSYQIQVVEEYRTSISDSALTLLVSSQHTSCNVIPSNEVQIRSLLLVATTEDGPLDTKYPQYCLLPPTF